MKLSRANRQPGPSRPPARRLTVKQVAWIARIMARCEVGVNAAARRGDVRGAAALFSLGCKAQTVLQDMHRRHGLR
jgi:hypothetical protein